MKKILIAVLSFIGISALLASLWFFYALRGLPDVSVLKHYRPAAAAEVLDKDGNVLTHYYDRKFRVWVPISAMPEMVIRAVITAEDDTFFEHGAVNYKATWDALVRDVEKRRFARGGSTITQQMIKNVLLSKEKTITRKLREYVLARKAEQILSKRRILEIYLNEVEWGDDINGIEAASRYYFDKHSSELTASEAALLAGMLPNPHYYNPYKRMKQVRHRQEQVLFNMHQAKLLTDEEYNTALATPVQLRQDGKGKFDFPVLSGQNKRPCYQVALEQILLSLYDDQELYRSGLTVRTTLDKSLQEDLRHWVDNSQDTRSGEIEMITVVKQGGVIRAITCDVSHESEILAHLENPIWPFNGYEVSVLPVKSLPREQIIPPSAAIGNPGLYQ